MKPSILIRLVILLLIPCFLMDSVEAHLFISARSFHSIRTRDFSPRLFTLQALTARSVLLSVALRGPIEPIRKASNLSIRWLLRRLRNQKDPIAQINDLRLIRAQAKIGTQSIPVTYENTPWPSVRYVRIGDVVLASRELILPHDDPYSKGYRFIQIDPEQWTFGDYLIPLLLFLVVRDMTNQTVEDDGTATGIGLQIALGLGASRGIGVDRYRDDLEKAKQNLEQAGYHGVLLEKNQWRSYQPKSNEQFILIH